MKPLQNQVFLKRQFSKIPKVIKHPGVKSVKKAKRPKKNNSESEEQKEEIILQSDTDVENDLTDNDEDWVIIRIFLHYVRNQSLMNLY